KINSPFVSILWKWAIEAVLLIGIREFFNNSIIDFYYKILNEDLKEDIVVPTNYVTLHIFNGR
ncbi:hypothetical protein, partial [Leptospira interrogans]|uniref:hypothetical protein n=1 Tax=Leptospira interrogans TaxID=173 RepID=UPI0003695D03